VKTLIILFAVFMIVVSLIIGWFAQRKAQGVQAFFGGTALFGPVVIGFSTMAAVASAFAVVGVPGLIYASGNTMGLWMMGSGAFCMGYIILGKKMRAMAELGPVATLGDVIDLRFGKNRYLKLVTSLTLFIGCIAYLASQIKGVSEMFAHLMGWSPMTIGLIVFGSLVVYMVISGEVGGLLTQAFQGMIMVVAAVILLFSLFWMTGGMSEITATVSQAGVVSGGGYTKNMSPNLLNAWGTLPGAVVLSFMFIPFLGVLGQPSVLTRMYSLKNPMEIPKLAMWGAGSHFCVAAFCTFTGFGALYIVAKGLIPPLSGPDRAVFAFADYIGPHAQFFVYAATLAAAMSSASMFLSLASSIVARDIPSALGYNFSPGRQIRISRALMCLIGFLSIYMGINSSQLVAILGTFGYGTFMAATFPVFIIGLLWDRCSSEAALSGAVTALAMTCVCLVLNQMKFSWPGGIPWYTVAVSASIAVTIFVSLFTSGHSGPNLDKKIRCVMDL
jgi:Na+/proline symporter